MSILDEQIMQLEHALASEDSEKLEAAIEESVSVFSDDIPKIKEGLDRYRSRIIPLGYEITYDNEGDARKLMAKLKKHKEKSISARDSRRNSPSVVVNANPVSMANASASIDATFSITMSQMWALPSETLSSEQKQELAKMLQEVEDSKGDDGKLKEAGKAVADWLFDHAVKAIPTVMPYITQAIGSIAG